MSVWFHSARLDLLFILPVMWLGPILGFIYFNMNSASHLVVIIITALLSAGHLFGPLLLYFAEPMIRQHVTRQRPNANLELLIIFLFPILASATAWFLLHDEPFHQIPFLITIAVLAGSYFLLNSHHFTMQNFGITCFYLNKSGIADRRWIHSTIWLVTFIIPIAVWYFSNLRIDFLTYFTSAPSMPRYFTEGAAAVVSFCLVGLFYRAYRGRYLTTQLALNYLSICCVSLLICLSPLFFTLTLNSAVHWIQSVFLTSYQFRPDAPTNTRRVLWPTAFLILIGISIAFFFLGRSDNELRTSISTFGKLHGPMNGLTLSALLVFGFSLSIAFIHFYLERYIYRANPLLATLQGGRGVSSKTARSPNCAD